MTDTLSELIKYSNTIKDSNISKNTYWIRKSKKIVLAVLCIFIDDKFYWISGINIEVCIASGTICAERNAISSAFSKFPNLTRANLINIAIAELDLDTRKLKHIKPCCLCSAWFLKIWGETWKDHIIYVKD